jgi:hypothetical protein
MVDPFASASLKVTRAKKHFSKLERRAALSVKKQTYELFSEPDPNKAGFVVVKMRLRKKLPDSMSELTTTVAKNLRESLDHALYAIAVAAGRINVRSAQFPFSRDSTTFENNLKGRCADVPPELWPLLRSYKPYHGGNDLLVGLNEICNADKHAVTVLVGTSQFAAGVNLRATGFMSTPYPRPVWDCEKNEMELFTIHSTGTQQLDANFHFASYMAFGKIGLASGGPVVPNLKKMIEMVEIILGEIKTEARKHGFIGGQIDLRTGNHET